jgi:hypothetical protein
MEATMETQGKRRYSIMAINDDTNPNNTACGNLSGMCCNAKIMKQREIIMKTEDAYKVDRGIYQTTSSRENTGGSSNRTVPNRSHTSNYQSPLLDRNHQFNRGEFTL